MSLDKSQQKLLHLETGEKFTDVEISQEELNSIVGGNISFEFNRVTTMALGEEDSRIKLK